MKKALLNLTNIGINTLKSYIPIRLKYLIFIIFLLFISCESFESPVWTTTINLPLLDEQYPLSQITESEGIVEDENHLVSLEFEDSMFDGLGIPSEYFTTSEFVLSPISFSLSDLVDELDIPAISINETIEFDIPNNVPQGLCLDVDDFHQSVLDVVNATPDLSFPIPTEVFNLLLSDYEYMTVNQGTIVLNIDDDNFLYPIKIEYTVSSEIDGLFNELFTDENTSINTDKNIGDNVVFDYNIYPDYDQDFSCNTCFDLATGLPYLCNGFEINQNLSYSIGLNGQIDINSIYSITGTTVPFVQNTEQSFPLVNNVFDILEGDISSETQNEFGDPINRLEFEITNNSQIPLVISLDLLNFINDNNETLELIEFTVDANGGVQQKITEFNGRSIQHYPTIAENEPKQAIDDIYMNIAIDYPSQQGTFILEDLYSFDIDDVVIKPIKFDRITTVVHDFIIDVPSLSLSSVPYGIEGLEFVNPILEINLDNQIKIDNTLSFYLQSLLDEEIVSELALDIILNIPNDSNASANTNIIIQGDSYTVFYNDIPQYTNLLQNGSNNPITLPQFLENTSDELRVSGKASLNGTGYLEPGDQASISGDFGLKVPFTIIVGEYVEPDIYTDINLFPSNPTFLSPLGSATKESIDNSLHQASMSNYIENNSIFVGSVSILVSTDENYFPLNFNSFGQIEGISECEDTCILDEDSNTFHNFLNFLKVSSNDNSDELEVAETNIGPLNSDNIVLIKYTPMNSENSSPKLIKFISNNDSLLLGRLTTLDLPYPDIDQNGNILNPGYINYDNPMLIDEDQIELINYTEEQKNRYINPLITLANSNYLNHANQAQNQGGIVNILSTHYIKIQSYMSFVITPGDY